MTFNQGIAIILLVMAGASLALFTIDRWFRQSPTDMSGGVRALFANPFLKVAAIFLMVLIVSLNSAGSITWLVVSTIGATVAGADFILLLSAILRGNSTFIQEFFETRRQEALKQHQAEEQWRRTREKLEEAVASRTEVQGGSGRTDLPNQQDMEEFILEASGRINILWVDDNPMANHLEVSAFREMNLGVDMRMTNKAAKQAYLRKRYDLIISDIYRETVDESGPLGLELPQLLEDAAPGSQIPPLVYYVHKVDAGITQLGHPVVNTPSDLLEEVIKALRIDKV